MPECQLISYKAFRVIHNILRPRKQTNKSTIKCSLKDIQVL